MLTRGGVGPTDQEMVRDCTPTRNRQCQCKPGEYYCDSEHCPEGCHPCTSCPSATLRACTATRDTVCAAQPGPAAGPLAVVFAVIFYIVIVIAIVIIAIIYWWRGAALVEPGSYGHILQTTDPESGPLAPDMETTPMLQEDYTLTPGALTRLGSLADPNPNPDPRAGLELQVEVEVEGGGREAPEPVPPTPAAAAPGALAWAEAAAGLRPPEQVPESSGPFVSSPETRDADAPVPTMGARLLPEDSLDVASESLILPGPPESPAGVDGPWPEAEAGDEAGPHAGHHGLTLLHFLAALA